MQPGECQNLEAGRLTVADVCSSLLPAFKALSHQTLKSVHRLAQLKRVVDSFKEPLWDPLDSCGSEGAQAKANVNEMLPSRGPSSPQHPNRSLGEWIGNGLTSGLGRENDRRLNMAQELAMGNVNHPCMSMPVVSLIQSKIKQLCSVQAAGGAMKHDTDLPALFKGSPYGNMAWGGPNGGLPVMAGEKVPELLLHLSHDFGATLKSAKNGPGADHNDFLQFVAHQSASGGPQ